LTQPIASVKFSKTTPCPSCRDYLYKLPFAVDLALAEHLAPLGFLLYPLDKFRVFIIRTDAIVIDSMLGRPELRVRFLKDSVAMSALFKACLSGWIQHHGAVAEFTAA
jgi:hypothetical protein